MKETEITVELLDDLQETKKKLEGKNFSVLGKCLMQDVYFSKFTLEDLKKMDYEELIGNSFLVRNLIGDMVASQIIYKEKVFDSKGNVVAEEKIVSNIDSFEDAVKVFELAGLTCWCKIKQEMTIFKKENIQFVIQEVEDLGAYIEFEEYDEIKKLSPQQKIMSMFNTLKRLGLKIGNDFSCKKVYLKFKGKK